MKRHFNKAKAKLKVELLHTKIKKRYPLLYHSLGGKYVQELLKDLYVFSESRTRRVR